ncbi:MAG: hypothetical protein QM736_03375 [Vicinamibacterales bacterium]
MGRIVRRRFTAVSTFLVAWLVIFWTAPAARAQSGTAPTFAKDVAPILYRSCVECHRPGSSRRCRSSSTKRSSLCPFHPHAHHQS